MDFALVGDYIGPTTYFRKDHDGRSVEQKREDSFVVERGITSTWFR
ncbi:hypothetical protein [Parapedobacter tibetensis]|nr:hypothetical protein [Parapedobacter tibetensis]